VRIGAARAIVVGFGLAAAGFAVLAFVEASWTYAAFVGPLVGLAIGLGIANGPASSASTSAVSHDQVGQASGISNMARYIGGSVAVAAVAMVDNAVINNKTDAGESASDALAAGLSAASIVMAIWCAAGVALVVFLRRHRAKTPEAVHLAAAAAATTHTIPTQPVAVPS
jgi:fucose permease